MFKISTGLTLYAQYTGSRFSTITRDFQIERNRIFLPNIFYGVKNFRMNPNKNC